MKTIYPLRSRLKITCQTVRLIHNNLEYETKIVSSLGLSNIIIKTKKKKGF